MMQRVQLAIADTAYAAAVREALSRSCAWHVESVDRLELSKPSVMVLDEFAFGRLPLPLSNPERIVLICRQDPQLLAQAWDAGIVSVLSKDDSLNTVLLAIMAAALRIAKFHSGVTVSGISPTDTANSAPIAPVHQTPRSKHCKTQ
jgi:DNA-binding NarL/FixJ family response regulator